MPSLRIFLALWLAVAPVYAGSMTLLGAGGVSPGGGSYFGPGDLGVSYSFYYGLRAYSSATRGNKLVNVCNSTGGTDVGCGDLSSSASTGQLVSATIGGITCPGANCTVKTYYDLTGGTNCSSAACDATQATIASRDTLGTSCAPLSVSVCATSTGGRYTSNSFTISAAPIFLSGVVSVTDNGNQQTVMGNNGATSEIFYWRNAGAHEAGLTGNGQSTILWNTTAYTNGYHSLAALANAASSYIVLDNGVITGTAAVNTSQVQTINVHGDSFSSNLASGGVFLEGGGALSAPSSATAQSINSNAKTFWGF